MFTGIIEKLAVVQDIFTKGQNVSFWIESDLGPELKVDQSVAHNGVCLTVEEVNGNKYRVTAIHETLVKTNIGNWKVGSVVNVERSLRFEGRIDGHIVQGHVDTTGLVEKVIDEQGSIRIAIKHPEKEEFLTVEKGSVCVNGVSLTVVNSRLDGFEVAIIPYTADHTNLGTLKPGDFVNLEFDILGKYAARYMKFYSAPRTT